MCKFKIKKKPYVMGGLARTHFLPLSWGLGWTAKAQNRTKIAAKMGHVHLSIVGFTDI
jgi:hypothetical protein